MRLIDADTLLGSLECDYIQALQIADFDPEVTRARAEEILKMNNAFAERITQMPTVNGWISVNDHLPENADFPGEFCPRYWVMTKYGMTEGWYNPDKGCWYTLVWFLIGRYTEDDIEMERGDIPKISSKIEVTHWMPLPELPKEGN